MRKIIGKRIALIGGHLWQNGGWTGDETYEDLNVKGKIGYKLFRLGCKIMGLYKNEDNHVVTK